MSVQRIFALLILGLLTTQTVFSQTPEPEEVDGKIQWVYDYEQGQLLSEASNKPMFVVIRCER